MPETTEQTQAHGYWWRYTPSNDEPRNTLLTVVAFACVVAADKARKTGTTYLIGREACGVDAIYVFACDHPDARNPAINIMFEQTPGGERIRRPGIRNTSRH